MNHGLWIAALLLAAPVVHADDIGLEPLFMEIRDRMPGTSVMSPLYREPVCLDARKTAQKN